VKTVAFFLEEPSSRVFLEELIKANFKIDPAKITIRYHVYEGKQDLEKNIEKRLRGWNTPHTTFVVLRDQDSGDCVEIKKALREKCIRTGRSDVVVRIACRELESFFLGDLFALEKALGIPNISKRQGSKKYRRPDLLESPSQEIGILLSRKNNRKKTYLKIQGARAITPLLVPSQNKSQSFKVLYRSLAGIFEYPQQQLF
jgi:hypothetical protein